MPVALTLYLPPTNNRLIQQLNRPVTTIGSRIRYNRIVRGLTQKELAETSGVARSYLEKLENDILSRINPLLIQRLSRTLGLQPSELIFPANEQNRNFMDYIIPPNSLGARIKNFRLKAEMSQKGLADKLKVSKACVCRYEKDKSIPSEKMLIKIGNLLKVDYILLKAG